MIFRTAWAGYTSLIRLMMGLATAYVGLMMVAIIYMASFRVLGLSYSSYVFPFVEYGFIYILMLGAPWMMRTRGHVFVELVTAAVPRTLRIVLSRLVMLIATVICGLLAWNTGILAITDFQFTQYDLLRADLNIPRWIITGALPIGFGLLAVECLVFTVGPDPLHLGKAGVVGEEA